MFLKFYYSCSAPISLPYIVCSCNLIIYPYFRPNLLFFSFLIILYIFNITRSLVLCRYLVDYLKCIPDKNLYNRVSPLGKIILLFISFFLFIFLFSLVISDIKLPIFPPPPSPSLPFSSHPYYAPRYICFLLPWF
jgi:hypothetical protein